jgi:hypothetical protein
VQLEVRNLGFLLVPVPGPGIRGAIRGQQGEKRHHPTRERQRLRAGSLPESQTANRALRCCQATTTEKWPHCQQLWGTGLE